MIFNTYTLAVTYFMAGLSIAAVSLVEGMDTLFVVAVSGLVVASFVLNLRREKVVPGRLWNVIAVATFLFFLLDYLSLSRDLVVASSRFLVLLLTFKLFDLKRVRDHLTVFALASMQMLSAAASTTSPMYFIILAMFIIGGIWAMIIISIKKDWSAAYYDKPEMVVPGSVFGPGFFMAIVLVSFTSLAITLAIFFIMPRMGMGFFESKTLDTVKVSGFSDTVNIGSIGTVKRDKTVVMRVELPFYKSTGTRPEEPFYIRGTALESYDGRSWKRQIKGRRLVRKDRHGAFRIGRSEGMLLEQNILLEPLETEALFGISHPVNIADKPEAGGLVNLWVDGSGSVFLPSPAYSRLEYTVWSAAGPSKENPETVGQGYLDTTYIDDIESGGKIRSLVNKLTADAKSEMAAAQNLSKYFRSNFEYTLSPKGSEKGDPLTEFLFNTKEGYCEHYATALAMLLRVAGIPSRVVTGFLPEEWNDFGGYFIVRQQDAHSWVEAYIDGAWLTFDPTPPPWLIGASRPSRLTLYLDLLKWRWNRYIVHFTGEDQVRIATNLEGKTSQLVNTIRGALTSTKSTASSYSLYFVAAVVMTLLLYVAVRGQRVEKGIRNLKTPVFYLEMLKLLDKKGFRKTPGETPLEFAFRVGRTEVMTITGAFHRERYGGAYLSDEETEVIRESIEDLKKE